MQDDVTDRVQCLIKEGIVDPKRVAIYGGYTIDTACDEFVPPE